CLSADRNHSSFTYRPAQLPRLPGCSFLVFASALFELLTLILDLQLLAQTPGHSVWSICCMCFSDIRSPCTLILEKSVSISRRSADVSSTLIAPKFSFRWSRLRVPGIGTIHGFCARSQASAI